MHVGVLGPYSGRKVAKTRFLGSKWGSNGGQIGPKIGQLYARFSQKVLYKSFQEFQIAKNTPKPSKRTRIQFFQSNSAVFGIFLPLGVFLPFPHYKLAILRPKKWQKNRKKSSCSNRFINRFPTPLVPRRNFFKQRCGPQNQYFYPLGALHLFSLIGFAHHKRKLKIAGT